MNQVSYDLVELQRQTELRHSRGHIRKRILGELTSHPAVVDRMLQAQSRIELWLAQQYDIRKQERLDVVRGMDIPKLVERLMCKVACWSEPVSISQAAGELASCFPHELTRDKIQTAGEILAALAHAQCVYLNLNQYDNVLVSGPGNLSPKTLKFIQQTMYLPPMVVEPEPLTKNTDSPHLTLSKSSVILGGKINHTDDDVCLDVLNLYNSTPLSLEPRFYRYFEERPPEFNTDEKRDKWLENHPGESWEEELNQRKQRWRDMVAQSFDIYRDLERSGNKFWCGHRYDKRGRIYCQGYHVHTQGNEYRKAAVDLHEKVVITGVPDDEKL